ncbi:c-type cytochrome [Oceanithermus sp.]
MRKKLLVVLLAAGALGLSLAADGETLYTQYCQACHMANGEGVPGQYPFIGGPIKNLSTFETGREFVIATTLFGLQGELMQRGYTYNTIMPGYGAAMNDEEVATLLNWIAQQSSWRRRTTTQQAPFTPEEVAAVRAKKLTPAQVHDLLLKVEEEMHGGAAPGGPPPGSGPNTH